MTIIALSGWRGSGKDTAADYLVKEYGFVKLSFAGILKDMTAEQYNFPRSHCDDREFKEKPILTMPVETNDAFSEVIHNFMKGEFKEHEGKLYWTPRALCILEGSVKRSAKSSYWVDSVITEIVAEKAVGAIKEAFNKDTSSRNFVISDLRYKSEIEQLQKAFGEAVIPTRIQRFEESDSTDPSERDLDNYDFDITIENKTGSINDLYKDLDKVMLLENITKE